MAERMRKCARYARCGACAALLVLALTACDGGPDPLSEVWGSQENRDQTQEQIQKIQDEQESTDLDAP